MTPGTAPEGSNRAASPRRAARVAAVQALYQIDLTGATVDVVLREFADFRFAGASGEDDGGGLDRDFFRDIVTGVVDRGPAVDEMVAAVLAEGWGLGRLDAVVRAILRAGAFELLARADVPTKVIINEYVEVSHDFFEGKETQFVNGALDSLARVVREQELEQQQGDQIPDPG